MYPIDTDRLDRTSRVPNFPYKSPMVSYVILDEGVGLGAFAKPLTKPQDFEDAFDTIRLSYTDAIILASYYDGKKSRLLLVDTLNELWKVFIKDAYNRPCPIEVCEVLGSTRGARKDTSQSRYMCALIRRTDGQSMLSLDEPLERCLTTGLINYFKGSVELRKSKTMIIHNSKKHDSYQMIEFYVKNFHSYLPTDWSLQYKPIIKTFD